MTTESKPYLSQTPSIKSPATRDEETNDRREGVTALQRLNFWILFLCIVVVTFQVVMISGTLWPLAILNIVPYAVFLPCVLEKRTGKQIVLLLANLWLLIPTLLIHVNLEGYLRSDAQAGVGLLFFPFYQLFVAAIVFAVGHTILLAFPPKRPRKILGKDTTI